MIKSLDDLLAKLTRAPLSQETVNSIFQETQVAKEAFSKYFIFSKNCYMRNLIHRTDAFELLVICWEPGQQTPLHDHNSSAGWMLPLDGTISETRYRVQPDPEPHFVKVSSQPAREISYIDDFIGMHVLHNDSGQRAATLHVYTPPISECRYYDFQTLATRTATMRYHSQDGVTCS